MQPSEDLHDIYICNDCKVQLDQAQNFKNVVYNTLNSLEINGLLKLVNESNYTRIMKNCDPMYEEDDIKDYKYVEMLDLEPFSPSDDAEGGENVKHEDTATDTTDDQSNQSSDSLERVEPKRIIVKWVKPKRSSYAAPYKVNPEFKCEICNEVLPNNNVFHKHMRVHYPNHICSTCGQAFVSIKSLKRHIPSHDNSPFKCSDCEKIFTNCNTLYTHRKRKHSNCKMYKCTKCDERFINYHQRIIHLAEVHGEERKKYVCRLCPKKFLISSHLSAHVREKHHNEKKFSCTECDYKCFRKTNLISHMQSHSDVKEFECDICFRKYTRKKALVFHYKTHNAQKADAD